MGWLNVSAKAVYIKARVWLSILRVDVWKTWCASLIIDIKKIDFKKIW